MPQWLCYVQGKCGWWQLQYLYFHPENWGRFIPILTVRICFKGVGEKPPTSKCECMSVDYSGSCKGKGCQVCLLWLSFDFDKISTEIQVKKTHGCLLLLKKILQSRSPYIYIHICMYVNTHIYIYIYKYLRLYETCDALFGINKFRIGFEPSTVSAINSWTQNEVKRTPPSNWLYMHGRSLTQVCKKLWRPQAAWNGGV